MKGFPSVASRELTDWIVFYLSVTPGVFQLHMSGRIWGKLLFRYKLTQVFPVLLQSDQLSWHTVFPVSSSRCHLRVGERDLNHLSSFYISIYCRCSAVLHESRWLQLPSTCKVLCVLHYHVKLSETAFLHSYLLQVFPKCYVKVAHLNCLLHVNCFKCSPACCL